MSVTNDTHQEVKVSVLVLYHGSARISTGSRDHQLSQLVEVVRGDGLRERQLSCKDRRNTDLIRLDIDVRRDDRAGGVVDTFALQPGQRSTSPSREEG